MKAPDDVSNIIKRRFANKKREWLKASNNSLQDLWPLEINLDIPTEQKALQQPEGVRAWIAAWNKWQKTYTGHGILVNVKRNWRTLGTQNVPEKLIFNSAEDVVSWIGISSLWSNACKNYKELVKRWSILTDVLPKHYEFLANSDDANIMRLTGMLSWICDNPKSNLYPRQIPVVGVDSKWLESHKSLVVELVATINKKNEQDFYNICGFKPLPQLIRMRILDPQIRKYFGGLCDISAPLSEIAALDIKPTFTFIVENLQTGLAFDDKADSVVIMGLGYGVDVLERIQWLHNSRCIYWGDIDTHGFAILNKARSHLPSLETILMDEKTLLSHKGLWVEEKEQFTSAELSLLNKEEQKLFMSLKKNAWGHKIRLEQERISWDTAWEAIQRIYGDIFMI